MTRSVSVQTSTIRYPEEVTPYIAPQTVYATALEMANSNTMQQNFNMTREFDVNNKALNELYFNPYINGKKPVPRALDLSLITNRLATPFYEDIIINPPLMKDKFAVQIGPTQFDSGLTNAILNGLELFKMNSASRLDGDYRPQRENSSTMGGFKKHTMATVRLTMMQGSFVGLGAMVVKWKKATPRAEEEKLLIMVASGTRRLLHLHGQQKQIWFQLE
ncbi:hypothetical protein Cgig2_032529 [Carnegiea gigantea]|uniref:Uncharacterized protein n=1 Tax=Carnegiea gigantea TaxID=171969 RepID=A0A9Q1KWD1_9CARY|nr:hypothetical protein Cgig2_032529 [Carnegiea gigantea]